MIRIVGIGVVCVNELLRVNRFPGPDEAARILDRRLEPGGMVATALAAAARLGAHAELWSVAGADPLGDEALAGLGGLGVDVSRVGRVPAGKTSFSVGLVGPDGRRAFLNARAAGMGNRDADFDAARLEGANVLLVEGYLIERSIEAALGARAAGIPVVADLNDIWWRNEPLARASDHLILPGFAARDRFAVADPVDALPAMLSFGPRVAGVTMGEEGIAFQEGENRVRQPAFRVRAVSTAGAGDVFRGAYAVALAEGCPLPERLHFAQAAAALSTRSFGVTDGLPDRKDVEALLHRTGRGGGAPSPV